jgi:hypothetical protein
MTTVSETESVYKQVSGDIVHQQGTGHPVFVGQVSKPAHVECMHGDELLKTYNGAVDPNAEVRKPGYAMTEEGVIDPSTGTGPRSPTAEYQKPGMLHY